MLKHKHLVVRAEVDNPIINKAKATKFLRSLIKKINMKPLYGPTASYCKMEGNKGITAFAIIETSHIAMHIWDESQPALVQLDVYSCSDFDPKTVFEHLESMKPVHIDYKFLDREKQFIEILNNK
jgi:S-adenosylmethionine/arginine decarboxylase-like enzyme